MPMMIFGKQRITIPDFEENWKWSRCINPHLGEIDEECTKWAAQFGAFSPKAQKAAEKCKFNLLAGLSYPCMTKDQLRSACELMNIFFIFDEHSDRAEPAEVWEQGRIFMDALRNPHQTRPPGEWIGGEMARQWWLGISKISTQTFQRRFLRAWESYCIGVAQQAELRSKAFVPDFETYFQIRRATVGTEPSFVLAEMDTDIPDEIRNHPIIQELETLVTDLVSIVNDVLSYNKEQASEDDEHNIVTVIMKERHIGVQGAIDCAGRLHADRVERFNELYQQIPRWGGPVDMDVQRLVDTMARWETGNLYWSFECGRYFGDRGLEVKATRTMNLLPKIAGALHNGPVVVEDMLLL